MYLARSEAKLVRPFYFFVLAGVTKVRLMKEEKMIVGQWKKRLTEVNSPSHEVIVRFLNWSNEPEDVLEFIKTFGPLHDTPQPGEEFRIHTDVLWADQRHFRDLWENLKKYPNWEVPQKKGHLAYRRGRLLYETSCLYDFLYLDLVTCPDERLRKCLRPDCKTPYFLALNLKRKYCSEACTHWAQSKSKREWWGRDGEKWRA